MEINKKYNLNLQPGKDFKIRENHWLPEKMSAEVFVFGKTMYFRHKMKTVPKHEYLHIAQFRKYGSFLVLLHYLFYLFINMVRYRNFGMAFKAVPFEIEARGYERTN